MKPIEAIEVIRNNYPPEHHTVLREGLDLAIEALEKQIPRKVVGFNNKCWDCGFHSYINDDFNFCPNCGQAVDLEDN